MVGEAKSTTTPTKRTKRTRADSFGANARVPSYAERMQRLLRTRAERKPLPDGYMRCPLNPNHQIPIAAIVTHLEKTHTQDSLSLAPDAMYGIHTHERRYAFMESQWRRESSRHASSRSSSHSSSRSSSRSSRSSSSASLGSQKLEQSRRRVRYAGPPSPIPRQPDAPIGVSLSSNAPTMTPPISTPCLMGQYPLGQSISRQALMEHLHRFGPLRGCAFQPHCATFTVEYETPADAYRCCVGSQPFCVIDGVSVTLCPMSGTSDAFYHATPHTNHIPIHTQPQPPSLLPSFSSPAAAAAAAAPPLPPPYLPHAFVFPQSAPSVSSAFVPSSQHPSTPDGSPMITVGGKPVGVAVLGGTGHHTNKKEEKAGVGNGFSAVPIAPHSTQGKGLSDVIVVAVPRSCAAAVDEKCLWKEFARFGTVVNLTVAGPRAVVEYAEKESAKEAKLALRKAEEFTSCAPLQDA